ncbi:MAG TPA: PIN domain-containing protein [Candidatus Dormibacteraeota bacterium]|nr:PIN domain-containing protein [Candidatus Dormibacteraeota bacterium]
MALVGCLDTRFYFAHAEGRFPWTRKAIDGARQQGSVLVSSTITITELLSEMAPAVGLETVQHRINSAKTAGIGFIAPSEAIASRAGEISLRDKTLPIADAIIASTALDRTQGRVYTDDPHFEKILGVHVIWGRA